MQSLSVTSAGTVAIKQAISLSFPTCQSVAYELGQVASKVPSVAGLAEKLFYAFDGAGKSGTNVTGGSIFFENSDQTPNSSMLCTSSLSNAWVMCERSDAVAPYDFAHALQVNPTLYIQSANQSATEWLSLTHDQTD